MSKTCSVCGIKKHSPQFYSNPRTKDGLRSECRECTKKGIKEGRARAKLNAMPREVADLTMTLAEASALWEQLMVRMEKILKEKLREALGEGK